jgi:hypothetical protein
MNNLLKTSFPLFALFASLQPLVAQADFCTKDPTDPQRIKIEDLGNGFRRFYLCLNSDRNKCEHLGDRYFSVQELSATQKSAYRNAVGTAGGELAGALAWAWLVHGAAIAPGIHDAGISDGAATIWGGAIGGAVGTIPVLAASAIGHSIGTETNSINPIEIKKRADLLGFLATDPDTAECINLPASQKINQYAEELSYVLNKMEPDARVQASEKSKKILAGAANATDPNSNFEPYKPSSTVNAQ